MSFQRSAFNNANIEVETFVGSADPGYVEDVERTKAKFNRPLACCFYDSPTTGEKELLVVDSQNHVIRKVNLENGTSLFAGLPGSKGFAEGNGNSSQFSGPAFVISYPYKHSEHYYGTAYLVSDRLNQVIRTISPLGEVNTLVGSPEEHGHEDGLESLFYNPHGICVDNRGEFAYVCDTHNHVIRRVNLTDRMVDTIVGMPRRYGSMDGIGPMAELDSPRCIAIDYEGKNLFVTDFMNNTVRKICIETREVTTLCGDPNPTGGAHKDGRGEDALFNLPVGLAIDRRGILVLSDSGNHCIRCISTKTGFVTTLVGLPEQVGCQDGSRFDATFSNPMGVAIHPYTGDLYVCDQMNHKVRVVRNTGLVGWDQDRILVAARAFHLARVVLCSKNLSARKRTAVGLVLTVMGGGHHSSLLNRFQVSSIEKIASNRKSLNANLNKVQLYRSITESHRPQIKKYRLPHKKTKNSTNNSTTTTTSTTTTNQLNESSEEFISNTNINASTNTQDSTKWQRTSIDKNQLENSFSESINEKVIFENEKLEQEKTPTSSPDASPIPSTHINHNNQNQNQNNKNSIVKLKKANTNPKTTTTTTNSNEGGEISNPNPNVVVPALSIIDFLVMLCFFFIFGMSYIYVRIFKRQ